MKWNRRIDLDYRETTTKYWSSTTGLQSVLTPSTIGQTLCCDAVLSRKRITSNHRKDKMTDLLQGWVHTTNGNTLSVFVKMAKMDRYQLSN